MSRPRGDPLSRSLSHSLTHSLDHSLTLSLTLSLSHSHTQVFEEIGYDVSPLLKETEHLNANLNDHKIQLYIVPGVPMNTG